jgi:hypothetical protein
VGNAVGTGTATTRASSDKPTAGEFRLKGSNYGGGRADAPVRIAGRASRFALIPIASALFLKTKN